MKLCVAGQLTAYDIIKVTYTGVDEWFRDPLVPPELLVDASP